MSHSKKKLKIKLSKPMIAQCRDRAKSEDGSVSALVKRAISQYLASPINAASESLSASAVSPADYARLLGRIEQLESQVSQLKQSRTVAFTPSYTPSDELTDEEGWEDLDEPDEILYDFLDSSASSS